MICIKFRYKWKQQTEHIDIKDDDPLLEKFEEDKKSGRLVKLEVDRYSSLDFKEEGPVTTLFSDYLNDISTNIVTSSFTTSGRWSIDP